MQTDYLEYYLLIHASDEPNIGVLKINIKEKDKVNDSPDFEKNLKAALEDCFLGYSVIIHEIKQTEAVFIERFYLFYGCELVVFKPFVNKAFQRYLFL